MDDLALLRFYLSERDVPCPRCGYALRDSIQPNCPECGVELRVVLAGTTPAYASLAAVTASTFVVLIRLVCILVLFRQDGWSLHVARAGWRDYTPSLILLALHALLIGFLLARRDQFARLPNRWRAGALPFSASGPSFIRSS